ncbi:family 43 glycosylhydrolase [Bacillus sp. FJAT-49711]|uniref:LamG-like jellyroll fold domain-containing protein n=1 Tax=Bacillus sp. FJAT-49711 TaxID=2833585 RepID=UPI001BC99D10|nr:LamG-like jellyroll fold domain-containing protein [Bacillus sp. FJAT-49711]MBS4219236.1 family 43 glycosylhydrolase [Bacillus sp. FJAT-49711]
MSKKSARLLMLVLLTLLLVTPSSVMGNEYESNQIEGEAPVFDNVSVHDPSIIKEGDTYYVFGTHIEGAKSNDLMSWTRFTNGYKTPGNALYGDLSANLAESFKWAGEDDSDSKGGFAVWAPEIFWNEHYMNEDGSKGAYMMYYSASSTYIRSAIGYAVSKNIEGPYTYVDTIMYSGFTRDEAYDANSEINKKWDNTNIKELIDDGTLTDTRAGWFNSNGSYNNGNFPNAIDANLFYDDAGKLWMTYGSWSGGIFILEIDKTTGKAIYPGKDGTTSDGRLIDRYFGTKISGGYGKSGEGPYVVYDQKMKYYYLYVTTGWLAADGEYNMRVFRSTNPSGPYVDAMGQNAVLPGNVDHSPYGNKIMGHFLFERNVGDPGTGIGYGYLSPGHNSVFYDEDEGKQFLVFHTRFPQRGETHEVRVHQLFINKDGWPVAAPYRYTGEKLEKINKEDIAGDYQFINHGKDISKTLKKAITVTLNKDGTLSGANGSWELVDDYHAMVTIDGKTYNGVFLRQWNSVVNKVGMTFTALSSEGVSIWGIKTIERTDEEIVELIKNQLTLGDTSAVIANLELPTEGARGTQISWESSNPEVVSAQGVVNRPVAGAGNATVTLTATITKGDATAVKTFTIIVLAEKDARLVAHYTFEGDLSDRTKNVAAGTVTGNRIDNSGGEISYGDGIVGQGADFDGESGVRLPNGLISSNQYSVSFWLNPDQLTDFTTTFFGARTNENWVSVVPKGPVNSETMVWSGSAWYDANTRMQIPKNEWSHIAFTVDEGKINVYVNGVNRFSGVGFPNVFTSTNAVFALGVNYWDLPFKGLMDELLIYDGIVLTEEEVKTYYNTGEIPREEKPSIELVKERIQQYVANPGIRNSLVVQLDNAQRDFNQMEKFLNEGKEKQAEQSEFNGYKKLEHVKERIEQHSGKHIEEGNAEQLISMMEYILENQTPSS